MVNGAHIDGIDYGKNDDKVIGSKVHAIIMEEFKKNQKPNEFWLAKGNTEIMLALLGED